MIFFAFTRIVFMISSRIPGHPASLLDTLIKHPAHQKVASILTPSYLPIFPRLIRKCKKRRGGFLRRALFNSGNFHFLMPVVIMIVVVPIALLVPATFMFIPPSVTVFPTPFPGLVELVPLVVCLSAVITVFFDRTI